MLWLGKPDVHVTWEPASSLPTIAIQDYESGLVMESVTKKSNNYGCEKNIIVLEQSAQNTSLTKRPRLDRPLIPNNLHR